MQTKYKLPFYRNLTQKESYAIIIIEVIVMNSDFSNENPAGTKNEYPSLHLVKCPYCGQNDFKILGTKGSKGAAYGVGMAFGAIGNLVANSVNKDEYVLKPVNCKCNSCGKKFEIMPLTADDSEILQTPCTVNFTRLSSFVGMAVAQHVYLNGVKIGTVGNGKTITFQTFTKHNTIFVTDQYGVAFKGDYKFEAVEGGNVEVKFKRKFV